MVNIEYLLRDALFLITSSDEKNIEYGTGFLFAKGGGCSFFATCLHVVNMIGGPEYILVGGSKAELVTNGEALLHDIAIIKISKYFEDAKPLALPKSLPQEANLHFISAGYVEDRKDKETNESRKTIKFLKGIASISGASIRGSDYRPRGWDLHVFENNSHQIQGGHSGSPVLDIVTSTVIGIVLDTKPIGKLGFAISVEALLKLIEESDEEIITATSSNLIEASEDENYLALPYDRLLKALKEKLSEDMPPGRAWVERLKKNLDNDLLLLDHPINSEDEKASKWNESERKRIFEFVKFIKGNKQIMGNLEIGLARYGEPIETINSYIPFWEDSLEYFDSSNLAHVRHAWKSFEQLAVCTEELYLLFSNDYSKVHGEIVRQLPRVQELANLAKDQFSKIESSPNSQAYKSETRAILKQLAPNLESVALWIQKRLSPNMTSSAHPRDNKT